jgi:beta-glucosidase
VELDLLVTNLGAMKGAEIVQVYLEPPGLLLERPRRSLVAFRRLLLQPGEQQPVQFRMALRLLACFEPGRDAFVLEGGRHWLVVARHADDPGQAVALELPACVLAD